MQGFVGAGSQPLPPVNHFAAAAAAAFPLRPLVDFGGQFVGNDDDDNDNNHRQNSILSLATSSKIFWYGQPKRAQQQPKFSRGVDLDLNGPQWH